MHDHELVRELLSLWKHLYHLRKEFDMFVQDATAKLQTQSDAIDALAARIPAPVDPATVVSVADQNTVLDGIDANTAKIAAILP